MPFEKQGSFTALTDVLGNLEKKVLNQIARTALRDAAKELKAGIDPATPVDKGGLIKSEKVRSGKRKKHNLTINVEVGVDDIGEAVAMEYGTATHEPQTFIRNTTEQMSDQIIDKIIQDTLAGINAAAAK